MPSRSVAVDISCVICGVVAMHIESTAPDDRLDMPRGLSPGGPTVTTGTVGIRTEAGTQSLWTAVSEIKVGIDAVRVAILAGDVDALARMDSEVVPFYCRECAASYCEAHWTTSSVFQPLPCVDRLAPGESQVSAPA